MWPQRGDALSRTIAAEQAVADLYAEALRRWAPTAQNAVLPALTAAALPPDPAAVAETQSVWDEHAEEIIIAGLGILWAAAVYESVSDMGGGIIDTVTPDIGTVALGIVLASIAFRREELVDAVGYVEATPALAQARDDFLAERRRDVANTPTIVQARVESALAHMTREVERPAEPAAPTPEPDDEGPRIIVETIPEDRPEVLRARAAEVLDPASVEMRDLARNEGYQAAGVMNHAVLTAAQESAREIGEQLEKVWICTLDGRTRDTHFAADGQRVPLDGAFTIGAEQLAFPGDTRAHPREWKNCRCRMGILAPDEPLPDEVDRHTERLDGRDSVAIRREGRTQSEEIERRRRNGVVRARDEQQGRVAAGGWVAPSEQEQQMTEVVGGPTETETPGDLAAERAGEITETSAVEDEAPVIDEPDPDFASAISAMVAASATAEPRLRTYDSKLFEDPKLTRPTAPTMNNDTGRIYGHLAEWGHTIRGGRDATPRNRNGYLNFHTSQVQLDNGKQLSVGRLTVQGGHAATEPGVTAAAARAHYDDVTTAFGLVRVGEDQFGIWFSGVPAPGVDPEVFQQGMTAQLSGDWRDCGTGYLDMIAAHAVNAPGFPIYSALTGPDGREMALVASLGPVRRSAAAAGQALTADDVKAVVSEVLAEERRAAEFASRRDAALTAARAVVGDPPPPLTPTERIGELLAAHNLTAALSAMPPQFKKYWLAGAGAAKIRWGTSGDFDRCRRAINAKIMENGQKPLPDHEIKGLCASLHREATGARPGQAPGEKGRG